MVSSVLIYELYSMISNVLLRVRGVLEGTVATALLLADV